MGSSPSASFAMHPQVRALTICRRFVPQLVGVVACGGHSKARAAIARGARFPLHRVHRLCYESVCPTPCLHQWTGKCTR